MKQNQKSIFILLILITLTPLIHSKTLFYGTNVTKVVCFWFLVDLIVLIYCFSANNLLIILKKQSLLLIGVLLYTFSLMISTIFSISIEGSLLSNFERMDGVINLLHFIVFFIVVSNIKISEKQWNILAIISCIVAGIVAIYGVIEMNNFIDGRVQSTLSNPLYVSIYLIFHFFLILIFIFNILLSLKQKPTTLQVGYLITSILLLFIYSYTIIQTESRAGLLSLIIGLLFSIIYSAIYKRKIRYYALMSCLIIICLGLFVYFNKDQKWIYSNAAFNRITKITLSDNSISSRLELFKMTLNGLFDRPFTGWGKESYTYFFVKYYSPTLHDNGFWYDSSHNFILDYIIEYGWVGLGLYLFMIGTVIYLLIMKNNNIGHVEKSLLLGYFISYLSFNLTAFDSYVSLLILFVLMIYIQQNQNNESDKVYTKFKIKWMLLSILLISFSVYFFVIKSFVTLKKWTTASTSTEITQLIKNYKDAYDNALIGKYDIGLDFAMQKDRVKLGNFDENTKKEYYDLSEKLLLELLQTYPNHPILLSQIGFVQFESGKKNEAIRSYEQLQEIAPNRQINLMDLAIFYMQNRQYDKAVSLFEKVYFLDKSYSLALLYKAYALSLSGNSKESLSIIYQLPIEQIVSKIDLVIEVFKNNNQLQLLLEFLSKVPDKGLFSQNTYLVWLQLASFYNDKVEIHSSIYSYYRHFLPENELNDILSLIDEVINKKKSPNLLSDYFSRFPER